jgi:hypothetical protein
LNDSRNPDPGPTVLGENDERLESLLRKIRLSADAAGATAQPSLGTLLAPLPQQILLQSMRGEIEHFLTHADLEAEVAEERRLFDELKALGAKVNASALLADGPETNGNGLMSRVKTLLRRLLWPLFRLVVGPRLHRQSQLDTNLVQFVNALAHLEAHVVSVQRHYKAHQSNLGKNLLRVLDLLHESDLRLNEKIDLLVADLDRKVLGLRQSVDEQRRQP